MKEIRWHGRGGQGAVIATRALASAFVKEGKWSMSFPKFGPERRGAPVMSFNRVDDKVIREKTQIYHPDCLIVIDPRLMRYVDVFDGINPGCIFIIDTADTAVKQYHQSLSVVGAVNATRIGLEEIGMRITNTSMLGAFARTTDWVKLESIVDSLEEYFTGEILKKNKRCVERAYEETTVTRF